MVILIIISSIVAVIGLTQTTNVTLGVGLIASACLLAIFARIAQAQKQQKEIKEILGKPKPNPSLNQ